MLGIELTPERPVERVAELGARAEDAGFDNVFAASHYTNRDPFVALSAVADRTDTVRVGPGVANPYDVHPVALASRVATLDEHSDGRAVFGVGAGDAATLANLCVERDRPLRRVLETVRVARRLWDGERVDHDGTFRAVDAGLNYADVVGEVPVYVGAQGPDMVRMAAKHADGVLLNAAHPEDVAWAGARVAEGAEARPESRGGFDFAVYASVSVAADPERARVAARGPVAFIAAGAPSAVLERHGIDRDRADDIGEKIGAGDFDAAFDAVTDAMLSAFCVAGTTETVAERVDELLDHADSVVAASPLGPDLDAAVSLAGTALNGAARG